MGPRGASCRVVPWFARLMTCMAFREVSVYEIREVLRVWLGAGGAGPAPGLRTVAARCGVDRKTARRYVDAAQAAGLSRDDPPERVDDELVAAVVAAVRPARPGGHGAAWDALVPFEDRIRGWLAGDSNDGRPVSVAKIHVLLARQGCVVPYRTLHRFASERCGFGEKATTVRVADGDPGVELQMDFGYLGMMDDAESGRRRKVHALIFTAAYSRHMFVWLTFAQTLEAVIAGCEAAWGFFGGVFAVLVPDNMKPVVASSDPVNPTLTAGWLDYSQHAGFGTDPARVRSPKDKPRVERAVQYVRGNFWAGEQFTSLGQAQDAATVWCAGTAGMRIHGSTCARPAELFTQAEQPVLAPVPAPYDQPILRSVKVHRDFHAEIGKALYSLPEQWIGRHLDARADRELVRFYHRGELVKTHPRQPAGGRRTDPNDLPEHKTALAMRDLDTLLRAAAEHGENVGTYAARLLDHDLPWTRMRAVYGLLGLVKRYGPAPVDAACGQALALDVVSVRKIASMLERATETTGPTLPTVAAAGVARTRFSREPSEFTTHTKYLTSVPPLETEPDHEETNR